MEVHLPQRQKILLVGSQGQLGTTLRHGVPDDLDVLSVDHGRVDIMDKEAVTKLVHDWCPTQIINAAAYTNVEGAEQEPDLAMAVNSQGVANLAAAAKVVRARLLHISTDYVFNGRSEKPYGPEDLPDPLSVYGKSKLAGEEILRTMLPESHLIVRTAWLYSPWGKNFVKKMLHLMREQDELRVISDQVGTPTSAYPLATILWQLVQRPDLNGTYHWTDAGKASWYDFACEIYSYGLELGLLYRSCKIVPIATAEFPSLVTRPSWSVLDTSSLCNVLGVQPVDWRVRLREVLQDFVNFEPNQIC